MRVRNYIPLLVALPVLPPVYSAQTPLNHIPSPLSDTITDKLSQDPDYTSLLVLLQRARLIPTLNKLNGSTFFAPTNDAISKIAASNTLWKTALSDDSPELRDNVQEKLRQELFYHLLNYTLPDETPHELPETLYTLHYPRTPVGPPSREPPPSPPWMPIPGGTLGGKPQRLRRTVRDDETWVGVDAFGKKGVKVVEQVPASNGVVMKINEVIGVPPDLGTYIWLLVVPYISYVMQRL
jgi:solute carrier family 25 (mitochondrial carnitine/acylcarnitine transporter), member 20/29